MNIRSQLFKGILEGCILSIIKEEAVYGYELSIKLQEAGIENVSEGSIYPILLRLQKEKYIYGETQKSPSGPNRKYYFITEDGLKALKVFEHEWSLLKGSVDQLLNRGDSN
ncbi:PadR family transcriptional regulator [Halalkalibacillus halophilus]|uniref:PadR family transcriptional regulator n=1 Tax=Halalkalibacillus halophilus TaxID=392827 RepID=UPI00048A2AFD|nr:PadR family transcriptional regulator [Halalkalibacillus halophilus]